MKSLDIDLGRLNKWGGGGGGGMCVGLTLTK
jgi:hypothetical protein